MESRPLRMLSGVEIVDRGRNVTDCILPEIGLKEVASNGSWLEAKQVQTALEARKSLLAAERIDKVGALSHAEWNDQSKLAEVTQQVGGYWQYIGHKVNGTFFLLPEEALFLIETNCLLLKHNQVTVSLHKAYSLLLDEHMTLTQYKVYASLSRIGYKVFRHGTFKSAESKIKTGTSQSQEKNTNESEKKAVTLPDSENTSDKLCQPQNGLFCDKITLSEHITNLVTDVTNKDHIASDIINNTLSKESESSQVSRSDGHSSQILLQKDVNDNENASQIENIPIEGNEDIPKVIPSIDEHGVIRLVANEVPEPDVEMSMVSSSTPLESHTKQTDAVQSKDPKPNKSKQLLNIYQILQQKIKNRQIRPADSKNSQEIFNSIPDCYNKDVITVKVPSEEYLPRNIFLNNTLYVLNLPELKKSNRKCKSTSSTVTVENRAMYRSIRNSSESETAAVPTPELPQVLPNTPLYQQPFGYFPNWRPRFHNYQLPRYQFNQHPFFYRMMHFMPQTFNTNRPRFFINQSKRYYDIKEDHFRAIHKFANRLKQFYRPTNNSIHSLHNLVARFNEMYNGKLRVTAKFDVLDDANVETIELDDDDVETKKPQLDNATYKKYLNSVKALAAKLKNLERKNRLISKQKRAFCNLLDNFNETFNTEFQLDSKGALIDKKLVVLDSSSDSDVVPTDHVPAKKRRSHSDNNASQCKRRKVLNPLSILSKVNVGASTSKSAETPDDPIENSTDLLKYFNKKWLPDDDDFGKAMPCPKTNSSHLWSDSQEFYDFISCLDLNTWVDLKLKYCSHMEAVSNFAEDLSTHSYLSMDNSRLKPILAQEPGADWATSLEKLRIIKTNTDLQETCLKIDFDVFNRDVQNFRKTDPPKPHFRVVCVETYSKFPSGAEVRSLHSRCEDNVTTVFAVVDVGSITYLQINPKDLPVYVGND